MPMVSRPRLFTGTWVRGIVIAIASLFFTVGSAYAVTTLSGDIATQGTLHIGTTTGDEGTLSYDTGTNTLMVNEAGNDINFQVETDTDPDGIFLDAGAETIDLAGGSGSTGCTIDASGNLTCTGDITGANSDPTPIFDFEPSAGSGVGNLTDVVFGATTLTTAVLCDNRTDTGSTFPCTTGGTFTENPSGVTAGDPAPFTDIAARASVYVGGVAHEAPDLTTGDVATDDFVAMWIGRTKARGAVQQLVGKYNTGSTLGWKIGVDASDHFTATVNATTITDTDTLDAFAEWDILALYCKHDGSAGSMRLYKNGYAVATGVCPSATSSAPTKHLTFGAQSDGSGAQSMIGRIAFVKVSTCTACMTTTSAMDAQAQQHAQEIMGVWPSEGVVKAPLSTDIRATVASIDIDRDSDGVVRLFRVGSKWLRVARRCDTSRGNTLEGCLYYTGYLGEDPGSQKLVQSTDFSTTWTQLNGSDTVLTNALSAPDGVKGTTDYFGDRLRAATDAVGTEHGVRQTSSALTASEKYTFSVFSILESSLGTHKQFLWLRDKTIGDSATAWFDRYSCTVGQVGTGVFANTDPPMTGVTATSRSARGTFWGIDTVNSEIICRFEIDVLGTAATHDFDIGFSDADGVLTSTTSSNQIYGGLWGAQVEHTRPGHSATTPVWSGTSAGTRNMDGLQFAASNIPTTGMLAWSIFDKYSGLGSTQLTHSVCTPFVDINNHILFKVTQSTGNGRRGPSYTSQAGGGFYAEIPNGGVEQLNCCGNLATFGQYATPASGSAHDGREHHARLVYNTNDVRGYFDGDPIFGVGDTTVSLPDLSSGHLEVGYSSADGLQHSDGLVRSCTLYDREFVPKFP